MTMSNFINIKKLGPWNGRFARNKHYFEQNGFETSERTHFCGHLTILESLFLQEILCLAGIPGKQRKNFSSCKLFRFMQK